MKSLSKLSNEDFAELMDAVEKEAENRHIDFYLREAADSIYYGAVTIDICYISNKVDCRDDFITAIIDYFRVNNDFDFDQSEKIKKVEKLSDVPKKFRDDFPSFSTHPFTVRELLNKKKVTK